MSLREAKQLVAAELRDIDTETVGVVSAIALDETRQHEEVSWCGLSKYRTYILQKYLHFSLKIV